MESIMKAKLPLALSIFAITRLAFAKLAITNVAVEHLVQISYTLSGDIAAYEHDQGGFASLVVTATDPNAKRVYEATSINGETVLKEGTHRLLWSTKADGLETISTDIVFSASIKITPAPYCVIDLSAGPSSSSYPVTYLAEAPDGGFNTEEFKTTKLALRRIAPGTFMMCGKYETTLTEPYYMGIFEVTQKQYELVMGTNPSVYKGETRPVESVSYDIIRGSHFGGRWPSSGAVDPGSFIWKIRQRTGLDFDLPTEAQWEYACRAGTKSLYNNGCDNDEAMLLLGRFAQNINDGKGNATNFHTKVGSYSPNDWGLYDMHGNVKEYCLDWIGNLTNMATDPKGALPPRPLTIDNCDEERGRVVRGGCYDSVASCCTSESREGFDEESADVAFSNIVRPRGFDRSRYGFRIGRTVIIAPNQRRETP